MRSEAGTADGAYAPSPPPLSAMDSAALVATLTDAVAVRRRFQFFAWTQGHLQSLLPHGVLVCGLPRGTGSGMFFDYFHNIPLPAQALSRLCHARDGVALAMLETWRTLGGDPLVVEAAHAHTGSIHCQLQDLGMGDSIAHAIPYEQSCAGAHGFVAFVSLRNAAGPRESQICSMLVPQVFATYCRALSRERSPGAITEAAASDGALSEREIEILHWVREGKSNHEIGMTLTISPLTVKNHIQRILRKLQASNRTQAVTKAISLRLLSSSAGQGGGGRVSA